MSGAKDRARCIAAHYGWRTEEGVPGTRKYLEDYRTGRTSENNPTRLLMNSWTPLSPTLSCASIDLICPNRYTKG